MEGFNEFFHAKIAKMMDTYKLIQKTHNPNKLIEDGYLTELRIGTLTLVSYMDVINMVKSAYEDFSFCLTYCRFDFFSKTEFIFVLGDKLLPGTKPGFLKSEKMLRLILL